MNDCIIIAFNTLLCVKVHVHFLSLIVYGDLIVVFVQFAGKFTQIWVKTELLISLFFLLHLVEGSFGIWLFIA
jgi:hypothetical protein